MNLTHDESRALAFIAALLFLSAAVRFATLPPPADAPHAAGFDLDAQIAATERAVEEERRRGRPLEPGERIDPNTASATELDRLPGVGPSLAARIVAAREEARFRSARDLTRVPGIGDRTAERLAPHLTLAPAPAGGVGAGRGRAEGPALVDLNHADIATLQSLPGVGPVLAARIIAHRDSAGPFPAVDSLLAVRGIGPATLERLRPRLRAR